MVLQKLAPLELPAKQVFILNYFWLKYVVGYVVIDEDDGVTNSWGEQSSGTNGTVLSDEPQVFRDGTAAFSAADIGRYLVVWNSDNITNNGVWKIAGAPDGATLILSTTLQGPRFVSDISVNWSIVDPTLIVGAAWYVLEPPAGLGGTNPAWQVRFEIAALDTTVYHFDVSPLGGWNLVGNIWGTASITPIHDFQQDGAGKWYLLADGTHIAGWTENAAGTGVHRCMYAGSGQTFRTNNDLSFAIAASGTPTIDATGILNNISGIAVDNITPVSFTSIAPVDSGIPAPSDNLVASLQTSHFDLRDDVIGIPIVSAPGTVPPETRGLWRVFHYCSDQLPYKKFVSGNRTLLSLGSGVCIDWEGSLVV